MAIDWASLLNTAGSVASVLGRIAPVAGGVLAQQGANTQGNQQNQILQMLLARAAQGVGPTGTTNAQGGTSSFSDGALTLNSGTLAPLQQLFQSVSQQALGTSQQSTEAAVLDRLRAAALPQENIQANSVANRLFNTGRLGTTGGANVLGQLSQAQQQADLQRQLVAGQESRAAQSSALQQALEALRGNQNISTQTLNEFQTGANAAIGSTAAANAGLGSAAALTSSPNFNTSAGTDAIASLLSGGLGGTGAGSGASGLLQELFGGGSSGSTGLIQQLFGGGATGGLGSLGGAAFDSWLTSAGPISATAPADISAFLSGLGSSGSGAGVAAGAAPAATTGTAAGSGAAAGTGAASGIGFLPALGIVGALFAGLNALDSPPSQGSLWGYTRGPGGISDPQGTVELDANGNLVQIPFGAPGSPFASYQAFLDATRASGRLARRS